MSNVPAGALLSDDGHYWWDGHQWQLVAGEGGAATTGDGWTAAGSLAAPVELTDEQRREYLEEPFVTIVSVVREVVDVPPIQEHEHGEATA
jgi:hypothetical protein